MKITMYELLEMVKDGKAPKRFKYDSYVWTYNYKSSAYWNGKGIEFEDYMDDGLMKYLNDTVEILEKEKKIPEKLENEARFQYSEIPTWLEKKEIIKVINENFEKHQKAIYEIIDYLKSKGE